MLAAAGVSIRLPPPTLSFTTPFTVHWCGAGRRDDKEEMAPKSAEGEQGEVAM